MCEAVLIKILCCGSKMPYIQVTQICNIFMQGQFPGRLISKQGDWPCPLRSPGLMMHVRCFFGASFSIIYQSAQGTYVPKFKLDITETTSFLSEIFFNP